jgi:hypothetical protein
MPQKAKYPPPKSGPINPSHRLEAERLKEKAESKEVLGRHKNSGQKNNKGAR